MIVACNSGMLNYLVGDEKGISLIAQAGFDAIDLHPADTPNGPYGRWMGDDYKTQARELLARARDHGLYYNQAHTPLTPQTLGRLGADPLQSVDYGIFERFFHVCQLLEIPHMVVHNLSHASINCDPKKKAEVNLAFFRRLKEVAQPYGVRVALENLYLSQSGPDSYGEMLDALEDDFFLACVDVGHNNMVNQDPGALIRRAGSRVQALHVHDNHVEYDEHLIPGMGTVDWDCVLQALADVNYRGDFNLEVGGHACGCLGENQGFDLDFLPEILKFTQRSARYLANKLEEMLQCK